MAFFLAMVLRHFALFTKACAQGLLCIFFFVAEARRARLCSFWILRIFDLVLDARRHFS